MDATSLLFIITVVLVALIGYRYTVGHSLRYIRGPKSPSLLFGHNILLSREDEVGELDREWINEFESTWRLKECFGRDNLWTVDPKAIQHIWNKPGYGFARRKDAKHIARQLMGETIVYADGNDHARIRKIMDPAFNTAQIRSFLPIFHRSASKIVRKWKHQLLAATTESDHTINVSRWFARATLDIIGEAAFDYDCGALDDADNELVHVYKDMFRDSIMHPTKATLLFRALWPWIPDSILRFFVYIPTKEYNRLRHSLQSINRLARDLISKKNEAIQESEDDKKRDILSILVKANASENQKTNLRDAEMTAQVATFLLAGHETSAGALTWLFWELAKNPKYQTKMREEIAAARDRVTARGDTEYTVADLESMTYVNAAIKEGLRLHPIVYMLVRVANRDDVIPLSKPIVSSTGETISAIPISKGQNVSVSVWGYNRLPEIWGDDADSFNPERFLKLDREKQTPVGVFANLMSFGGGNRACLGWRFTILELQAIIVELIENFEFAIPADKPDIQRVPAGVMVPMIRGKMRLGSQMPLKISIVQ